MLNSFFGNESLSYHCCKTCEKVGTTTQNSYIETSESLPQTAIILYKRYDIVKKGNHVSIERIDSVKIIPDDEITLGPSSNPVKYNLRSVICHIGTYGAGHYIAYVKKGDAIIMCDDEDIEESTLDIDIVEENCYMFFYEKVGILQNSCDKAKLEVTFDNHPSQGQPIQCAKPLVQGNTSVHKTQKTNCPSATTSSVSQLELKLASFIAKLPSFDKCYEILKDIKDAKFLDRVNLLRTVLYEKPNDKNGLHVIAEKSGHVNACQLYKEFVTYITSDGMDVLNEDAFAHIGLKINAKATCGNAGCTKLIYKACLEVPHLRNLTECSFEDWLKATLMDHIEMMWKCECGSPLTTELYNFPDSLVMSLKKCSGIDPRKLLVDCNVTDILKNIPKEIKIKYSLLGVLVRSKTDDVVCLIKTTNGFIFDSQSPGNSCLMNKLLFEKLLNNGIEVMFFLVRKEFDIPKLSYAELDVTGMTKLPIFGNNSLKIPDNYSETVEKFKLNVTTLKKVLDMKYWFSADLIDAYMSLLTKNQSSVISMPAGWFNQRLFWNSDLNKPKPIHSLQGKKAWFEFGMILIPVNVGNYHWILFAVDTIDCFVYVCDSKGKKYENGILQLLMYLGLECIMKSNFAIVYDDWKIFNYSAQPGFPIQFDSSSCGPYVCMMAKCIVYRKRFPTSKNEVINFRKTIANELLTKSICREIVF